MVGLVLSFALVIMFLMARPQDFGQLADVLVREGIVRAELESPLHGIFALRNLLVHDYLALDRGRFHEEVTRGIPDIEAFCQDIARLLAEPGGPDAGA